MGLGKTSLTMKHIIQYRFQCFNILSVAEPSKTNSRSVLKGVAHMQTPYHLNRKALVLVNLAVLFLFFWQAGSSAYTQNELHIPTGKKNKATINERTNITRDSSFSPVAKLYVTFPEGPTRIEPADATGAFIAPDKVITAAHAIYNEKSGGKAIKVVIIPGYDNGKAPFGTTEAREINLPLEYAMFPSSRQVYDFAVLVTAHPLGNKCGVFSYKMPTRDDMGKITIVGYPFDVDRGETMVKSTSEAYLVRPNGLQYQADTYAGMSGAPILNKDNVIIGLHTRGESKLDSNFGVQFHEYFLKKQRY
jgi:V8-like Glu-specific endopeptidase